MPIERKSSVGASNFANSRVGTTVNSSGYSGSSGKVSINPHLGDVAAGTGIAKAINSAVSGSIGSVGTVYNGLKNGEGLIPSTAKALIPIAQKADDLLFGKDSTKAEQLIGAVSGADLSSLGYASGLSGGSSGGYGYGGSAAGSVGAAAQAEDPFDKYMKLVRETTDKNNQWAADQAQKQMDFQKEMSDTAHQRETKDLIAAGLNPILSATGGNGASSPSGAMATPDTSNTRLLAEAAMQQLTSIGGTAVQLATASGGGGRAANNFKNSIIGIAQKYVVPTLARQAANAVGKAIFRL